MLNKKATYIINNGLDEVPIDIRRSRLSELCIYQMKNGMSDEIVVKTDDVPAGLNIWSSVPGFELGQRMAVSLANSDIVPSNYHGNDKIGNCLLALDMAQRMQLSPLTIMQNLNIIKGKPSFGATFVISLVNTCGLFKTKLRWEEKGTPNTDDWGYRAYAIDKYGDKLYGAWVTIKMAKDDEWYSRNDKWKSMPEQMLIYRAAVFFQRRYAPELTQGFHTTEEIEDMPPQAVDVPRHEVEEVEIPDDATPVEPIVAEPVEEVKDEPKKKIDLDF